MNQPDSLNKDQLTNTGALNQEDAPEQGLPVSAEQEANDATLLTGEIQYFTEKQAVLDFYNAEQLVLDEPHTSESTDLDCIVKLYDKDNMLLDIGSLTLREAYEITLKGKEDADKPDEDDGLAPLSEAQQAWVGRNPRFLEDQDFQAETIGAHEAAVRKGLIIDSNEYFAFIDARLKLLLPESPAEQSEPLSGVSGTDEANLLTQGSEQQKSVVKEPSNG